MPKSNKYLLSKSTLTTQFCLKVLIKWPQVIMCNNVRVCSTPVKLNGGVSLDIISTMMCIHTGLLCIQMRIWIIQERIAADYPVKNCHTVNCALIIIVMFTKTWPEHGLLL